jgi:disulfide bond formation protein DsbB
VPASVMSRARLIALATPLALLGGAYVSQYAFGLYPCEMCWWQRYPHFVALAFALLAYIKPPGRAFVALAGLALLSTGLIGAFHAGVEYGWWQGLTACSSNTDLGGDPLGAILNTPMVRCDVAQWSLLGISLAGWNFVFSTTAAIAIFVVLRKEKA